MGLFKLAGVGEELAEDAGTFVGAEPVDVRHQQGFTLLRLALGFVDDSQL